MFYSQRHPRRRAAVAALVAVMLPILIGFTVITVDVGTIYNARADMQRAADSAALAAASEYAYAADGDDPIAAATAAAADFVARNPVLGRTMYLNTDTDLIFGRAYYDKVGNTYSFVPGDTPTNAVRVAVRHAEDSPNGPLPLYFAGVFGKSVADVSAASVAMFVPTCYEEGDCYDEDTEGSAVMCHNGAEGDSTSDDSESSDPDDDDSPHTIIVDANAVPLFLTEGDTLGACDYCPVGDSDDSDDSQGEFGPPDSSDSDDSDSGDSDGSENGDSDDSDDSQGEFGPPDSDDSDDSDSGDSDGSDGGDSDDSDDSQGEFGPPDSDDSDDSDAGVDKVTICHIPPGNPDNPQTITVGSPAVPAHLAHGDALGACPKNKSGNAKKCAASSVRLFLIE